MDESKDSKLDRIRSWIKGNEKPIWNMQLQPTDRCNLSCRFCWRKEYTREFDELSDEKWLKIVKEACEMDVKLLTFVGGGEPTLRSDVILKASEIMEDYETEGAIVTNGTLFSESLVEKLVKRGWEGIAFSINGTFAKTDDYLRGREGTFGKTMESIELFNYWRNKVDTDFPKLTIQMVITKHNHDQILPMYYLAEEMDIDIVLYRMVNEGGDEEKEFYIEDGALEIVEEQLEKVHEMSENSDVEIKQEFQIEDVKKVLCEDLSETEGKEAIEAFTEEEACNENDTESEKEEDGIVCAKPFSEMVILADGTSHPCCVIAESKYNKVNLGLKEIENIKGKSLEELWKGEKMNYIRRLIKNDELPERCKKFCTLDMIYREKSGAVYEDRW